MSGHIFRNPPWPHALCAALIVIVQGTLAASVSADEIYFKSGYSRTAVVLSESEDSVTFKTDMGIISVSADQVDFIERASDEENRLLRKKWRKEELEKKEMQEERRAERERFEQEQREKGFVKFEGAWMSPEEKQNILRLREDAREHFRQFEEEQKAKGLVRFKYLWVTKEHQRELNEMEPVIYDLYNQIRSDQKMVEGLRSAMANSGSLGEAEEFSDRIEEMQEKIKQKTERLGELLKRADQIEAVSVRYEMPQKFKDVFPTEEEESPPFSP